MTCNYSDKIAMICGINSALLAGFLWEEQEERGEWKHNRLWTAYSQKKLSAVYPFMKEKAIRNALKRLICAGIISKDEFNESRFDRTASYSFTGYGEMLMREVWFDD